MSKLDERLSITSSIEGVTSNVADFFALVFFEVVFTGLFMSKLTASSISRSSNVNSTEEIFVLLMKRAEGIIHSLCYSHNLQSSF